MNLKGFTPLIKGCASKALSPCSQAIAWTARVWDFFCILDRFVLSHLQNQFFSSGRSMKLSDECHKIPDRTSLSFL
jgi:hypothetical protein